MTDEWRDPDDRVVAPVIRLAQLPEVQARGEQRPVDAGGELLHARVQRLPPGGLWRRLDDAGGRVRLHQAHQRRDAVAAHDTVRIQDDHVSVLAAPAPTEIRDVPALPLDAMPAPAIEDVAEPADRRAQIEPGASLRRQRVRLAAVAENEEVELRQGAGAGDRLVGRPNPREHARHVLVANGHDDRRAGLRRNRGPGRHGSTDGVTIAGQAQEHEPTQRCPESE